MLVLLADLCWREEPKWITFLPWMLNCLNRYRLFPLKSKSPLSEEPRNLGFGTFRKPEDDSSLGVLEGVLYLAPRCLGDRGVPGADFWWIRCFCPGFRKIFWLNEFFLCPVRSFSLWSIPWWKSPSSKSWAVSLFSFGLLDTWYFGERDEWDL